MDMEDITNEIQVWMKAEEMAGRIVDINRINEILHLMVRQHNSSRQRDLLGLTPEQIYNLVYLPFSSDCVVRLKTLDKEQYDKIPLIRQVLFLMDTLSKSELKLTKHGWLPLKIVAEAYKFGQPEFIIEELNQKRINEYEAHSVAMARVILELLGWIKTRKGMLSITARGKKALTDSDFAANEILRVSLTEVSLNTFDGFEDSIIGNFGIAFSVWLLNKFGGEWHCGKFYHENYRKVLDLSENCHIYEVRVFERMFYWLGLVEIRNKKLLNYEYKKTELLSMIFEFI